MLGDRVKQRRQELALTQEQLAARSGLKQFHISRIEHGDFREIKSGTLRQLALALGVTADYLLEIDTPPTKRPRSRKTAPVG
jgi:transcriptional regulator with XRE-family HTH domain